MWGVGSMGGRTPGRRLHDEGVEPWVGLLLCKGAFYLRADEGHATAR